MQNKVIYDALSITSKIHQVSDFIEMLGLQGMAWKSVKGAHGYQDRFYYETISIHFNGSENMGIWLEMMGQGCRAFETHGTGNYERLFDEVFSNPGDMKITRLDVAFDDLSGILDLNELCDDTRKQKYVSKFNEWQVTEGSKGNSIYHGSMQSDVLVRIYDKAMERGFTDGRHWIRVELQLRRDRAMQFAKHAGTVGDKFAGVIRNYVRYVEPQIGDSNKWRYPLLQYWSDFLQDAESLRIFEKPGTDYNMLNLENFVFKQAGNAIDTFIQIRGEQAFYQNLIGRNTLPNAKYEELKRRYGNVHDN